MHSLETIKRLNDRAVEKQEEEIERVRKENGFVDEKYIKELFKTAVKKVALYT